MKKTYIQPNSQVVNINLSKTILVASETPSGKQGNYTMSDAFGDKATEDEGGDARQTFSIWDDDDE